MRSDLHLDPVWRRPTAVKESGLKRLDRSGKVERFYNWGPVPRFPTGSAARDLLWVQKAGAGDAHRRSRPSHQILPGVRIGGSGKSSRGNFATLKVVDQQPLARRRIAGMPPGGDRIRPWRVSHQNTLGPAFNRNRRRWKTFHFGAGCKIGTIFGCVTFSDSASFWLAARKHTFPGAPATTAGAFAWERASAVMRRFLASGFHPHDGRSRKKTPKWVGGPGWNPRAGAAFRFGAFQYQFPIRTAAGHLRHDGQIRPPLADPVGLRTSNSMIC